MLLWPLKNRLRNLSPSKDFIGFSAKYEKCCIEASGCISEEIRAQRDELRINSALTFKGYMARRYSTTVSKASVWCGGRSEGLLSSLLTAWSNMKRVLAEVRSENFLELTSSPQAVLPTEPTTWCNKLLQQIKTRRTCSKTIIVTRLHLAMIVKSS